MTEEEAGMNDVERIDRHVRALSEHFDSVQIVITRDLPNATRSIARGSGNWYARYGSVKAWISREEETLRIETRQDSE